MNKSRYFKYFQPNAKDLKDEVGDCSIRAFCKAFGMEWVQVFDILYKYARDAQCLPNQKPAYEAMLKDRGWTYHSCVKEKLTVDDFCKKHRAGTYIMYVRSGFRTHLVTEKDGQFFDTWDCGSKLLYGYYTEV